MKASGTKLSAMDVVRGQLLALVDRRSALELEIANAQTEIAEIDRLIKPFGLPKIRKPAQARTGYGAVQQTALDALKRGAGSARELEAQTGWTRQKCHNTLYVLKKTGQIKLVDGRHVAV